VVVARVCLCVQETRVRDEQSPRGDRTSKHAESRPSFFFSQPWVSMFGCFHTESVISNASLWLLQ